MESAVGYVVAEDVYIVYSEYYGDGTIYGRADLLLNGEPVRGAGKSKKELVEAGVVLSETVGSVNGDLVAVPDSNEPAEAAPEVAPEAAPACACACGSACACACACAPECACVKVASNSRYTVSMVIAGFTVSRELNVKINEESRQIYLSE